MNPFSWIDDLVKQSGGSGRSSTKVLWLYAGVGIISTAVLASLGGVYVYVSKECRADAVFWAAVTALWTTGLGFIQNAKKHQVTATKEIALADRTGEDGTP